MYGVIYWENDDTLKIVQNLNGTVWIAETVEEADLKAEEIEAEKGFQCRTVSLEGVIN